MLKKRISANLVVKDGIVVQSMNFQKYLPIGKPTIAIEFLNQWGIDEIILLDISASSTNTGPNFGMIKEASAKCYVPLTVGGGINSIEHVKELMHCGADKISLNQASLHNKNLISNTALTFGNQCVVVSIDAIYSNGKYFVYDYLNKKPIAGLTALDHAKQMEELGAGEILINSVDRDGSYKGYDINLINEICNVVTVPVICCGGARNAADLIEVFNTSNVSAASAGNFFHFTEHSVITTKSNVLEKHLLRLETHANYTANPFNKEYRLLKKDDNELEEMLFVAVKKEKI